MAQFACVKSGIVCCLSDSERYGKREIGAARRYNNTLPQPWLTQ